jgi:hypothetical protein
MTARPSRIADRRVLSKEIDELLLHLRGLVLVRDVLAARGATSAVIDAHSRELDRRREQLADLIRGRARDTAAPALGEAA